MSVTIIARIQYILNSFSILIILILIIFYIINSKLQIGN